MPVSRAATILPALGWLARSGPKRASGFEAFFFRILQKRAIPAGEVWMNNDGAAWVVKKCPCKKASQVGQRPPALRAAVWKQP